MEAHENGRIIKMGDNIHWLERYEENFLPDHKDINTFIKISSKFYYPNTIWYNKSNFLIKIIIKFNTY